jgi:hypothetical protein
MAKALGDARKIVVSRQRLEFTTPIPLRLLSSETFKPGVLNLVYGPARSPSDATYEDAKVHLSQPDRRQPEASGGRPLEREVGAVSRLRGCQSSGPWPPRGLGGLVCINSLVRIKGQPGR